MTTDERRPEKGLSLIELPSDYVLLDLETTGLNPAGDSIIEIGAIKVKEYDIVDTFEAFVKPPHPISYFITDLTGITNEMVKDAGSIETVLPEFMRFVGSSLVMGHNVNFDINFLYENCVRCFGYGFRNDFVDTLRLSRKLFPEEHHHRLCDLEQRFQLHNEHSHRALSDVILTNQCYDYMRSYMAENRITIEEPRARKYHRSDCRSASDHELQ